MPETLTASSAVLDRFGGHIAVAKLLSVHRTTTYRWLIRGIPRAKLWQLQQLARREGVQVTRQEWIAALGGE
jgi:hypothetical protein